MDLASLKAELKAWERAFKAERGRDVTPDDIRQASGMPQKYKLFKALSKSAAKSATQSAPATGDTTKTNSGLAIVAKLQDVPSTPPRTTPRIDNQPPSLMVRKTLPRKANDEPGYTPQIHPFSPAKQRQSYNSQYDCSNDLFGVKAARAHSQGTISLRSPSPDRLSTTPAPDSPFTRARKRLRGEESLPTIPPHGLPEKRRRLGHEKRSQSQSTLFPQAPSTILSRVQGAHEEVVPESPQKNAAINGKGFRPIVDDGEPRRLAFTRSKTVPIGTELSSGSSKAESALPLPKNRPPAILPSSKPVASSSTAQPAGSRARKRTERESESDPESVSSIPVIGVSLLPPSPPVSSNSGNGKGKNKWKTKKMKFENAYQSEDDSDSNEGLNVSVEEWTCTGLAARPPPDAEMDEFYRDLLIGVDRPPHRAPETDQTVRQDTDEHEEEIELPEEMLRVLALSPPKKALSREKEEESVVQNLFAGRRTKKGIEVWGPGEVEGMNIQNVGSSEDDEWESEVPGWWEADL